MLRPVPILVAAVLALSGALWADKLDELGLDRRGCPLPHETSPTRSVVLTGPDGLERVPRPELGRYDRLADLAPRVVELLVAGPTAAERSRGLREVLPAGTRGAAVEVAGGEVTVRLELPASFLLDPAAVEADGERILYALQQSLQSTELVTFRLLVLDPRTSEWTSLDRFLPPDPHAEYRSSPDLATPGAAPDEPKQRPRPGDGRPQGALSGKDVYLNQGQGWVWRDSDYWGLQRGFVQNNIEDFSNPDLVSQWLAAYCYNAGADVFAVRETDPQTNLVVVDDGDGAPAYTETGAGWFSSSLAGYANGQAPYVSGEDPFSFGGNRLAACAVGSPTAWATWTAAIPADGWYNVSVSHSAYTNRSPQAHYRVFHAGGESDFTIDQRQRRFTWIPIGSYYFEADAPAAERQVVLYNDSSSAAHYVSADAVRFGGGVGLVSRGTAGVSGEPRFVEEARYHLQYAGAPDYDGTGDDESDGWSRRPRFGRWLKQGAEAYGAPARDSVFLSSHTNAGGGTGLSTFVYTGYEGTWHDRFRNAVHDEVLYDLANGYPGTYDTHGTTGKNYGTYGENSPANVSDLMPIFLGEWLFHDSASDMTMYHDPVFRRLLARAAYQGIVKFWAAENGSPDTLLPEPPRNLRCVQSGPTTALLSWDAPVVDSFGGDAATGYRLYRGNHGRGFPPASDLGNVTSVGLTGLVPGEVTYVYLTATNAGGESFPSEQLAVRTAAAGTPKLLLVNGFDKLDVSTRVQVPWSGSTLYRQLIHRMSTFDYVVEHARAIAASGSPLAFDSCEDEAISLGAVSLSGYGAVIWIGGNQSEVSTVDITDDTSLTAAQQSALTTYLNGGGRLLISSAEVAWDLDRGGTSTFVDTALRANYVADDSDQYTAVGVPGSLFDGLGTISFDDGSGPTYAVYWPDVIAPVNGSSAALEYGGAATVEDFDDLTGWWDPNSAGQTDADPASAFTVVASPVYQGSGSGDLSYVWGTGSFIREYNSGQTPVDASATLSAWVHGDGSGHQVRLCVRDADNDLFVSTYLTVSFSGWQSLSWSLTSDPVIVWYANGNGVLDGPEVAFDSIHVLRNAGGPASGHLYFDAATASGSGSGMVAAVAYDGTGKLVYLGFPFETILGEAARTAVMARVLGFFALVTLEADLGVRVYSEACTPLPGEALAYTIVVDNQGPSPVTGARVTDLFPAELTGVAWTCSGTGGGTCTASGAGDIDDSNVSLPAGAEVRYQVTGTLSAGATGWLANLAQVEAPAGYVETAPEDNSATHIDPLGPGNIFCDSFDTGSTSGWSDTLP